MADLRATSTPARLSPPLVRLPKLVQGVGFAVFGARRCGVGSGGTAASSRSTCRSSADQSSSPTRLWCLRCAPRAPNGCCNVQPNLEQLVRARFGVRARRLHASRSAPVARAGIPRAEPQNLRRRHRGRDAAGDVRLGLRAEIPNARTDEQDHVERDPADPLRRRCDGTRGNYVADRSALYESRVSSWHSCLRRHRWAGRLGPWGRLDKLRRPSTGSSARLSPTPKPIRRSVSERTSWRCLVRSRVRRRTAIPPMDLCDELLTLIGAGHETTASALGWTFERLRRHPDVLAELVSRGRCRGSAFRRATILELLRSRTVIDVAGRRVRAPRPRPRRLANSAGPHGARAGSPIFTRIPNSSPPRTIRSASLPRHKPAAPSCLAFGGGPRRCLGADFAIAEMDVVLRTVLQNFRIQTDCRRRREVAFPGNRPHPETRRPRHRESTTK